jgi:hypothetical protein
MSPLAPLFRHLGVMSQYIRRFYHTFRFIEEFQRNTPEEVTHKHYTQIKTEKKIVYKHLIFNHDYLTFKEDKMDRACSTNRGEEECI